MKHRIKADTFGGFERNLDAMQRELISLGLKVVDIKMRMKTYNGDASGYVPRYTAVLWTSRNQQNKTLDKYQ